MPPVTTPQWDPSQQHTQADPLGAPGSPYPQANPYATPGYQAPGYPTSPANPYTTPSYGAPGYAAPGSPQGYPQQQQYPAPYPAYMAYPAVGSAGETNTMAILALVFAFVFAPAGIVLGHIARNQIRTRGGQGDGLALAGLIMGYIFTIIGILVVVLVLTAVATCVHNGVNTCSSS